VLDAHYLAGLVIDVVYLGRLHQPGTFGGAELVTSP